MKTGDKVICVKTHSKGKVKEGEIYYVTGVFTPCCTPGITVGIARIWDKPWVTHCYCDRCDSSINKKNYPLEHVFAQELFRKLDETFAEETLERIKEQIEEEELVKI